MNGCPGLHNWGATHTLLLHIEVFITTVFQKVAVKGLVLLKLASSPAEKGVWAAGGVERLVILAMKVPLIQREP